MNTGLDTSIVLRLLTGEPQTQARRAFDEVENLLRQGTSIWVSDLVAAEVYFALQHHYGVPKADALSSIQQFLKDSGVKPTGVALEVLATPNLATANPGFVDRLILGDYQRSSQEILTFEKAENRLAGVRVLCV